MKRRTTIVALALIAGLPAMPTPSAAQTVTRGPYFQTGTETGIVVRWRTDVATDSRVRYGTVISSLNDMADDDSVTTEHVVTLTALASETLYYYSIGTTTVTLAGDDADHFFRTAPPPGSTRAVRVWIIGDSGQANQAAANVRDAYLGYPGSDSTDVWLMLGDNAYNLGTDTEYQAAVFDMYPSLLRTVPLWPTRGNHDTIIAGADNDYYDIFSLPAAAEAGGLASGTEAYYSFDYANVHFVCLDSEGSDRTPSGPMLTWLAQDLAATAQDWIIAYWHHPPYSKGSHNSDTEGQLIDMRQYALPILEAGGVDLVLSGHSHSYERSFLLDGHYGLSSTLVDSMKVNIGNGRPSGNGAYQKPTLGPAPHEGAVYAVAGSSSQFSGGTLNHPVMITSLNKLGSLVLDIDGDELDATFIDHTGAALDSFTILKGQPTTATGRVPTASLARLSTGRPNPFGSHTELDYFIPAAARVELTVYDVLGRRVRTLLDRHEGAGDHTAAWDTRDDRGRQVTQGVYFAVLRVAGEKRTQRLVVLR
jgi:Calcineurin-like phosphoesterase/Purple acid Phosphatase, N-terminal domain/FlgD Ig-like domain